MRTIKNGYTGPRKRAKHDLSDKQNFLVNEALDKIKWYGQSDEAGDFQTSSSSQSKAQIKAELISYIVKISDVSPLLWFREKGCRFAWKDCIKHPVDIILKLHPSLTAEAMVDKILTAETISIVYEATLLKKMPSGNTCMQIPKERLLTEALRMLNSTIDCLSIQLIETKLNELTDIGYDSLWKQKTSDEKTYISTKERGFMDKSFFKFLTTRSDFFKIPSSWSAPQTFTEEQQNVYNTALRQLHSGGWSVISGPGGSGKTHMLKSLREDVEKHKDQSTCIYFLGPTNRAVTILRKSLDLNDDNSYSGTIHAITSRSDLQSAGIVVIDESSMCASEHGDLLITCKAFSNACFLFVGDHLQLPPVGAGELLKPLLSLASMPVLTENHRASGKLQSLVNQLRNGHARSAQTLEKHCHTYNTLFETIYSQGCSLVLCLRNEERIKYNSYVIKKHLTGNPKLDHFDDYRKLPECWSGKEKAPRTFIPYVGMKVRLQTNVYKPVHCRGMLGEIIFVHTVSRTWYVHISFEETPNDVLKLEEGLFTLPDIIRPGFATTLHDAQGSASESVAIIFPPNPLCPLLNLESLYTAASRAKEKIIFFTFDCKYTDMVSALENPCPPRSTPLSLYIRAQNPA